MAEYRPTPIPTSVDHYEINKDIELGQGAFATVYLGRDTRDDTPEDARDVAIKRVTIKNKHWDLLITRELLALETIKHDHVIQLLHFKRIYDHRFFVLECCDMDLKRFAEEIDAFCNLKVQFVEEFALAVQCLHKNEVIHRDIKPDNVLVKRTTSGSWITKMSDLGLICYIPDGIGSASFSASGGVGTWDWMAPEVTEVTDGRARYGRSADMFSLGLLNLSVANHRPKEELAVHKGNICIGLQ